jgi:hypothetical protein
LLFNKPTKPTTTVPVGHIDSLEQVIESYQQQVKDGVDRTQKFDSLNKAQSKQDSVFIKQQEQQIKAYKDKLSKLTADEKRQILIDRYSNKH